LIYLNQLFIVTKFLSLTEPTGPTVTGHAGPTDPVATGNTGPTGPIATGNTGSTGPIVTGHTGSTDNIPTFRVQDILAAVDNSSSDNDL
jgi:hypothetical protein